MICDKSWFGKYQGWRSCQVFIQSSPRGFAEVPLPGNCTWPHPHYLMRQCNWAGGWVGGKLQVVQVVKGAKSITRWREKHTSISFIVRGLSTLLKSMRLQTLGPLPPILLSYPALLRPPLSRERRLPWTLLALWGGSCCQGLPYANNSLIEC